MNMRSAMDGLVFQDSDTLPKSFNTDFSLGPPKMDDLGYFYINRRSNDFVLSKDNNKSPKQAPIRETCEESCCEPLTHCTHVRWPSTRALNLTLNQRLLNLSHIERCKCQLMFLVHFMRIVNRSAPRVNGS